MKYRALATDYDGTIAQDGVVGSRTIAALQAARDAGLRMVLVTGRELSSLFNTFDRANLFDIVVAENGAVLHFPAQGSVVTLSDPPPPALLNALQAEHVPISSGHSIIATVTLHEHSVRAAIRSLGLDWHVVMNKDAVMALPNAVTKATGLCEGLRRLGVTAAQTVGVGDAENDVDFLQICGLSVAVANALPSVKSIVDRVTVGARGAGVEELVNQLVNGGGIHQTS